MGWCNRQAARRFRQLHDRLQSPRTHARHVGLSRALPRSHPVQSRYIRHDHLAVAGARAVRNVAATLNAGFTSVRELAGYGVQLA